MNKKHFGAALRRAGFTSIVALAQKTHIHRNTINQYLKGKSVFADSFERIADALGEDPTNLIAPSADIQSRIKAIDELRPIVGLINKHDARIAVVLIGSRAKGTSHTYADWDVGITLAEKPIDGQEFLKLKSMVAEIADDLVRGVDLINLDAAPGWFVRAIDCEPVFLGGNEQGFIYFKGVLDGAKRDRAA